MLCGKRTNDQSVLSVGSSNTQTSWSLEALGPYRQMSWVVASSARLVFCPTITLPIKLHNCESCCVQSQVSRWTCFIFYEELYTRWFDLWRWWNVWALGRIYKSIFFLDTPASTLSWNLNKQRSDWINLDHVKCLIAKPVMDLDVGNVLIRQRLSVTSVLCFHFSISTFGFGCFSLFLERKKDHSLFNKYCPNSRSE